MARGLTVNELAIELFQSNRLDELVEVDGQPVFGTRREHGEAALQIDTAIINSMTAADHKSALEEIWELLEEFQNKHMDAGAPPLAPIPILNDLQQLVSKIWEAMPDEL